MRHAEEGERGEGAGTESIAIPDVWLAHSPRMSEMAEPGRVGGAFRSELRYNSKMSRGSIMPHSLESAGARSVCLLGVTDNTNNYGVRVLLSGAVAVLSRTLQCDNVQILDYGRKPKTWTEHTAEGPVTVRVIDVRYSWRFHLPNNIFRLLAVVLLSRIIQNRARADRLLRSNVWLRQLLEAQSCLALSGGDSFSDLVRLKAPLVCRIAADSCALARTPSCATATNVWTV